MLIFPSFFIFIAVSVRLISFPGFWHFVDFSDHTSQHVRFAGESNGTRPNTLLTVAPPLSSAFTCLFQRVMTGHRACLPMLRGLSPDIWLWRPKPRVLLGRPLNSRLQMGGMSIWVTSAVRDLRRFPWGSGYQVWMNRSEQICLEKMCYSVPVVFNS